MDASSKVSASTTCGGTHTPEPWMTWECRLDEMWRIEHKLPDNAIIVGWAGKETNARRIVACVNACAGASTEDLENGDAVVIAKMDTGTRP